MDKGHHSGRIEAIILEKTNNVIKDFLMILFPKFAKDNHERLVAVANDFRKMWSNWRNTLWKKLC